jgi:hypothetical protein
MFRRELFFLLSAGALAVGCNPSLAPIDVVAGCPEQPLRGPDAWASEPDLQLIDDFESHDGFLPAVGGRNGAWVPGMDPTGISTAEISSRCAARGGWAGHFSGSGFTDWGANWTAVFRNNNNGGPAVPYDGSAYSAISFWVAAGAGATAPLEAPVGLTTMDNAWNSGGCTTCMDYYGTTVPLTPTWQRQVIHFSDLVQSGFGVPQVPVMRRDQLVGFIIWPKHQFDVWIDDVRFEP